MLEVLVNILLGTVILGTTILFIFMVVNVIKWTFNSDF